MIEITYMVNATGARVMREFRSEYQAQRLKNKLLHSRKCTLISYLVYPF